MLDDSREASDVESRDCLIRGDGSMIWRAPDDLNSWRRLNS